MNKILLAAFLSFVPVSLACADLKVAVIDLSKAFDSYYKTKEASARIEEKKATYTKEIQEQGAVYQRMQDEAKKLYDAVQDQTLSEAARKDKAEALKQKNQDLLNLQNKIQEMQTEKGNEIKDELMRRHKDILEDINKVITAYSGPQGFDLVIDKSSVSAASGASLILYNSSKLIDITGDVIKQLNATAPAGGAAPAPAGGAAPAPAPAAK